MTSGSFQFFMQPTTNVTTFKGGVDWELMDMQRRYFSTDTQVTFSFKYLIGGP